MPRDFTIRPDIDLTDVRRALAGLSRTPTTLKLNTKGFKPLGRITGELGEFEKSLAASNARVIAFGASTTIIMGIQRAFSSLIKTTIDVEKQLTDINVIMNASASGLQKFSKELFRVAAQTGQTFSTVATAATELARQGLTAEETLLRVRDAMILTRLSGMDAVESVNSLTAAINSFNKVAITSTELVNKMANVDAAFAVSAGDLAKAISRVGSSAQSAGVDIDQLMAIVTSAQQTTARGGAVIGNSFKTIFTRIERPRVVKELEKMGVAVKGFAGELLPAVDILNNLAKTFDILTRSERAHIAELVGGVFQVNILKAAMTDLNKETSIYSRALGVSAASTNQAIKRNEELNKTLAATLNETVANFQSVGSEIGKLSLEPAIRRVLGLTNKLITSGLDPRKAEDTGANIGQAIFKGLGDFLKGPGLAIGGIAIFKLLTKIIVFSADAAKSIVGVGQSAKHAAASTQAILGLLTKQPQVIKGIADGTISIKTAHDGVIAALETETKALRIMDGLSKDVAATLSSVGLGLGELGLVAAAGGGKKGKGGKRRAAGHIPNAVAETIGAVAGGYTPGKIAQTNIQGLGRVTYNTAETIKQFSGFSQPAIMPPERSRAGKTYRQSFSGKHGFNPYASGGMIPNFAAPMRIKPGKSISYGGKTINIEEAKIIVRKMDLNPRPGRSSDERTQNMLSRMKGGGLSGFNNDSSAALLLTNSSLGQSYSSAVRGRADAASAQAAATEAKKIRQASAPRLNTVLMRNLEQVGTNVHGVARYGMNKNMMPDARERFQSSFETRYKQMMDGLADDMFSQGGAGKMKDKLMSQYSAQGMDKNARPQVMGRVWESFLQGMGSPVDPRLATSGMARKDFSNYKMKPAFRGLFTPGPATQMGFTGGEARLSGISSKKAYEKMGIDPRLYMAGGHVPNFAKRTEVSYPMAGLDLAPTRSGGKVDGIDTARMSIALGGDTKKRGSTRATPYQLPWDTSQYRADATGISEALLNNKGIRDIGNIKGTTHVGGVNDGSLTKKGLGIFRSKVAGLKVLGRTESATGNKRGKYLGSRASKAIKDDGTAASAIWRLTQGDRQKNRGTLISKVQGQLGEVDARLAMDVTGGVGARRNLKNLKILSGNKTFDAQMNKKTGADQFEVKVQGANTVKLGTQIVKKAVDFALAAYNPSKPMGDGQRQVLDVNKGIITPPGKFLKDAAERGEKSKVAGVGDIGFIGAKDSFVSLEQTIPGMKLITASQGFVPNLMRRRVFDIDAYKQKYAADPALLQKRLGQTGAGNIKGLFDYDVMQAGKKGHLTVVNAAAGAGKTTFAMGNKGSMAYSAQGVKAGDRSVVVRASESMTAGVGGLFNKSYTPYVDKYISLLPPGGAVREGRRSRNMSGQYMFGRSKGQTAGASVDFTSPAAVIQSMVGGRHRALTRGMGANQKWGSAGALPNVHTLPVAAVSGAFSPFHMGHQKVLDAAQKSGLPTIVHVAAGKNRKHDIGLSIGRKSSLIKEGNPGVAVASGSNLPENFRAPKDMVVKIGGKTHNIKKGDVIQATPQGNKLFVGSDRVSKSGVRGIYNQVEVPRGSRGLSATEIRGDIMSGDKAALSKKLPPNWNKFISSNLGDIQKQQGMMASREAKKLAVINEEKALLWGRMGVPYSPHARNPALNKKRVAEYPNETARIAELNAESKKALGHKWRKRIFPELAGGFVPNFRTSSMDKALKRSAIAETAAGQGSVRFGSDPRLIASGNPIGIGTYNTSEGSLSKAIAMHRGSGVNVQSLASLGKNQQASDGLVPNFVDPTPTYSVAAPEGPKFSASAKKWWAKFRDPSGMTGEMDPKTKKPMTKMQVWTSDREKRKVARTNAKAMGGGMGGSGLGMALMFGGPMAATMGGRLAEETGLISGRAAAQFSGGVEQGAMAGMIASMANPFKKFKKTITLTIAALGYWRGSIEGGRKFDIEQLTKSAQKAQSVFTKMANASAKYIETIESFEAGVVDPRTTPQTLARLQRQSNKSLAKLSPSVRAQLAGGVTPEERRDIVAKGVTDRQGKVEQGMIAARLSEEGVLGAQAKPNIDAETADRLLSDAKSLAFGLSNFEDMVKSARGAINTGQDPQAALSQFGFTSNVGSDTRSLLKAIEEMKDKGLLEQKLYDQMKAAVGAGGEKTVRAIIDGMAKTVTLEAKTRKKIDEITVAKYKENKQLQKFRTQFEDFKASQETAKKLTEISIGAGTRSGKRFLSAKGQAQFQFEASQMQLKGKTSAIIGNIQARLGDTIKESGGKMLKGLSGEQRARVQGVLAPQEITGGYRMELQSLIGELERGGADNALLSQLINLESTTRDQLRVQKEQTKIQQAIKDAAIQEARELQNIQLGGGIRSFMNVDEQNQRFGRLASSSIQTRMGIGNGGRSFVNQSAVMQELLGGDLGGAKGITTAATADAMIPQKRKELLTAARMVEMNARFQRGPQREASLAQAAEARKIANDPARMLEAMTQQAADFFNVDTLKDGVAQGLDNSAVGQAWLKALPEQRARDIRSPFARQGLASNIRSEEKAAQRRQSDTSRAGSVGSLTKALNEMTDKITEGLKQLAMGSQAYQAWKDSQEGGDKGGFIPSFNLNRTREMGQAGVSRAQTYQWNVPGFGPAVGNRIHEPSPSALQMAVMSHGNPRFAGSRGGFTPNFAAAQGVKYPWKPQTKAHSAGAMTGTGAFGRGPVGDRAPFFHRAGGLGSGRSTPGAFGYKPSQVVGLPTVRPIATLQQLQAEGNALIKTMSNPNLEYGVQSQAAKGLRQLERRIGDFAKIKGLPSTKPVGRPLKLGPTKVPQIGVLGRVVAGEKNIPMVAQLKEIRAINNSWAMYADHVRTDVAAGKQIRVWSPTDGVKPSVLKSTEIRIQMNGRNVVGGQGAATTGGGGSRVLLRGWSDFSSPVGTNLDATGRYTFGDSTRIAFAGQDIGKGTASYPEAKVKGRGIQQNYRPGKISRVSGQPGYTTMGDMSGRAPAQGRAWGLQRASGIRTSGAAARHASLDLRVGKITRNKVTLQRFLKSHPKALAAMVEANPEGAKRIIARAGELGVKIPKVASSAVASATRSSAASAGVADDIAKLASGADDVVAGGAKKGIGSKIAQFLLGGPKAGMGVEAYTATRGAGVAGGWRGPTPLGLGRNYRGNALGTKLPPLAQKFLPKVNWGALGGNVETGVLRGRLGKVGYGMSRSSAHLGRAVRAPAIIGGLIEAGMIKYRYNQQGKDIDEQLGILSSTGDVEGFKKHMLKYNKRRLKEEKYAIGATIGGIGGAALATAALPLLAGGPPGWAAFLIVMAAGMATAAIGGGLAENSDADWVNNQAKKQLAGNVIFGDSVTGMDYDSLMTQDQRRAFDRAKSGDRTSGKGDEVDPLQQVRRRREAIAYTVKRSRYKVPVYGYKTYRSNDPRFPGRIMRQRVQTGWRTVRSVKKTRIGGYAPPVQSGVGAWWNAEERTRIAKQRKERFANTDERGMYKGKPVDYWNKKEIQESYKRWNDLDPKYRNQGATPMGRPHTGKALPTDATGMPDPSMFGPASQPRTTEAFAPGTAGGSYSSPMPHASLPEGDIYGKFRNSDGSIDMAGFDKWRENLKRRGAWGPHLEKTFTAAGLKGQKWSERGTRGRSGPERHEPWWDKYPDYSSYLAAMRKGPATGNLVYSHSRGRAGGFVPNFSLAAAELNNSYSNSGTRAVGLRGIGLVNTAETLGHHPRFSKPFVNPPEGSREGMLHKMRAISKTGINPYRILNTPISSQGSIPEIDTSNAQSSLGALTQEFDNLKIVLAAGGFIPNSSDGTSTITNNMTVHANGGTSANSNANPEIAKLVDQMGVQAMAIAKIPGGRDALAFANRPKTA